MRLGVYVDLDYRRSGSTVSTEHAVIRFLTGLARHGVEPTFFGRVSPVAGRGPYPLPPGARFVELPHYGRLADLRSVASAARGSATAFASELESLDAVWLFGPHPLSLLFASIARRRKVPVFLGVRQDFPQYVANRIPNRAWAWAIPAAWIAEQAYRRLARRSPTVVVGEDLASRYGADRRPVLETGFSLIAQSDLVPLEAALARRWDGDELRVLNVGRLDPEKNPLLLPEVVARLREHDRRWKLAIAGVGPLADAVRRRSLELGLADAVELLGYVPNGDPLREEYRRSHAFLHVSLTEGLPQVLFEAQAAGLPIVATDVGGVSAALRGGQAGLLAPADDAAAAAAGLERLRDDEALRHRLVASGLHHVAGETLDVQLQRIISFFLNHLDPATAARAAAEAADRPAHE